MSSTKSTPIMIEGDTDNSPEQGRAAGLKRCIDEITSEESEIQELQTSMEQSKKRLKVTMGKMEVLLYGKVSVDGGVGKNTEGDVVTPENTATRDSSNQAETAKEVRYSIYQQTGYVPPLRSAKRLVGDKGFTHDFRVANAAAQAIAQAVRERFDRERNTSIGGPKAEKTKSEDSNMLQITVIAKATTLQRAEMSIIWMVRESA